MKAGRVVHVIERLSLGGAGRCLLGLAKYCPRLDGLRHACLSILPPEPAAVTQAEQIGLELIPWDADGRDHALAEAEVVHIHFWNSPRLMAALSRPWPAARVAVWCHVSGDRPPQILTRDIVQFSDAIVASSPHTAELPVMLEAGNARLTRMILSSPDFSRLDGFVPRAHDRFTVGHVGTLDFVKLHEAFVAMHAVTNIPGLRVRVAGRGAAEGVLRRQAVQLGCAHAFEFPGSVEDLPGMLGEVDVYGNPLCPDSYATAELAIQEAMYAGIPPVVLSDAGPARMIEPGVTGLVVRDPQGYAQALIRLHREPDFRQQLGRNAAAHARESWGIHRSARQWSELYDELRRRPRRIRSLGWDSGMTGAARFVRSLGGASPQFRISASAEAGEPATDIAAGLWIADASPLLSSAASGGILHYRLEHPGDPHLRFWSGLVLARQGRPALALAEFRKAIALGMDASRIQRHTALPQASIAPETGTLLHPSPGIRPRPAAPAVPPWVIPRRGLPSALERLRGAPEGVAYLGNSVTAQRNGYRTRLHEWLRTWSGQPLREIPAGIGGVGSFGCAFLLQNHVLRHRPALCFVECTTGDLASNTRVSAVGPAVEGIVRQLLAAGCDVCLLHLGRRDRPIQAGDPVLAAYEAIADHYGIPSLHLYRELERLTAAGDVSPQAIYRDPVHTTTTGALQIACLAGSAIAGLAAAESTRDLHRGGPPPVELPPARHRDHYQFAGILAASDGMLEPGTQSSWKHFRLAHHYLEVPAGGRLRFRIDEGDLAGLLLIVGPRSASLRLEAGGTTVHLCLRDEWCDAERLHALPFPEPVPAGTPVVLTPESDTGSPTSAVPGTDAAPVEACLQWIGLLVRRRNLAPHSMAAG